MWALALLPLVLVSRTSWGRTKSGVFFSKVLLPWVLEPALVYYLKKQGPKTVLKHWRAQLGSPVAAAAAAQLTSGSSASVSSSDGAKQQVALTSFRIELATVRKHHALAASISAMVNGAYVRELRDALAGDGGKEAEAAFMRTSVADIERRLVTDAELESLRAGKIIINRVLFLAVAEKDGAIVGTCAATLSAPWTGVGVGSWGLLAVGEPRGGVGRRLVEHCEQYLKLAMLPESSIEYFCIEGHASSERLRAWYERLGYVEFKANPSGQSYRGNEVKGEVFFRHASKPLDIAAALAKEAAGQGLEALIAARKRGLAAFLLADGKDD